MDELEKLKTQNIIQDVNLYIENIKECKHSKNYKVTDVVFSFNKELCRLSFNRIDGMHFKFDQIDYVPNLET